MIKVSILSKEKKSYSDIFIVCCTWWIFIVSYIGRVEDPTTLGRHPCLALVLTTWTLGPVARGPWWLRGGTPWSRTTRGTPAGATRGRTVYPTLFQHSTRMERFTRSISFLLRVVPDIRLTGYPDKLMNNNANFEYANFFQNLFNMCKIRVI